MHLEVAIQEKIQELIDNKSVDGIIETHAKKAIDTIVQDVFRSYGTFGKELEKVITEKLEVSIKNINISSYELMIQKILEEELNTQVVEDTRKRLSHRVKEVLEKPEKQEWKLSEIVEKYRDEVSYRWEEDKKEVVVQVEESDYGSTWIRMGEKAEKSYSSYSSSNQTYDIRMMLDRKDKKINGVWYEKKQLDPRKGQMYSNSFEAFMMKLWANGCTMEVDQDEAEYIASKSRYDD